MRIRQERDEDEREVYRLIAEAFASAEHTDGKEQDLAAALRKGSAYIPELSLVAETGGEIVGHILFTKAHVGRDEVLVLAPLSVKPSCQKRGIGTALIAEGHKIAKKLGYSYSLVLGSETYYPRMGYVPAEQFGITVPQGIPAQNFMALKLREDAGAVSGAVAYAEEFGMER